MAPPLRNSEDVEALWNGIKNDHIDVIATDHCPFFSKEKLAGKDDFREAPGGIAGVEERMEIVLTEGIKRGIPLNSLIAKLATNPAKIYGLYPRKGTLKIGSDGDLILVKREKKIINKKNRHSACDYTAYEGFETDFSVNTVLQRGKVIIENNNFVGNKGDGVFIKRGKITVQAEG